MGQSISRSCLGSLLGESFASCLGAEACKPVDGAQAARCSLLTLQGFLTSLVVVAGLCGEQLIHDGVEAACGEKELGVCACTGRSPLSLQAGYSLGCQQELVYRIEAAGVLVFLVLMGSSMCGRVACAASTSVVWKALSVLVLAAGMCFAPEGAAPAFGQLATLVSSVFLIGQAVLLIDFGYYWNELWRDNALSARRRNADSKSFFLWLYGIVLAALFLCIGSLALCIFLSYATSSWVGATINVVALVSSFILAVLSVLQWCEHGSLLTSMVVMSYVQWLVWNSIDLTPDFMGPPFWIALVLFAVSLTSFTLAGSSACSPTEQGGEQGLTLEMAALPRGSPTRDRSAPLTLNFDQSGCRSPASSDLSASRADSAGSGGASQVHIEMMGMHDDSPAEVIQESSTTFAIQCGLHASAALHVCGSFAPQASSLSMWSRYVAICMVLIIYGWSLAAPKVLAWRDQSSSAHVGDMDMDMF